MILNQLNSILTETNPHNEPFNGHPTKWVTETNPDNETFNGHPTKWVTIKS